MILNAKDTTWNSLLVNAETEREREINNNDDSVTIFEFLSKSHEGEPFKPCGIRVCALL